MKRTVAFLALATTAHAGGLARPNNISARGVGMGGAWTAWSDDATALWFNPAALSEADPHVHLGGELVIGPREYTPVADDGTRDEPQAATAFAPVPALGIVGRFHYDDMPSRFTLGAGVWNTFGGRIRYPKTGRPALDATQNLVIETAMGTALRISDRLSVGGAFRLGVGLFAVESTESPYDANLSASGVGVGMTWGVLFRPRPDVRIGATWRSPLNVTTTGSGTIEFMGGPQRESIELVQKWPQQASLGVGIAISPRLKLAAQLDWSQWSRMKALEVTFPANPGLSQAYRLDWRDNWAVRAGADYTASSRVALRGGAYVDTPAVPDRTIERQYQDSLKVGLAAGATVTYAAWRFDLAVDGIIPRTRTVPNNSAETVAFPANRNKAPGDYRGTLITFELAAAYRF